ncbi:MAG: DUF2130 domain-containing protein [Thermoproteota archaeon]|nr:DUF2130 domain-containing protein [Thermoproteota archaeon]
MISDPPGFKELKCPYCGKLLNGEEYNHAVEEFKTKAAEEYREQIQKREEYYNDQFRRQEQLHQQQIQELAKVHTEDVRRIQYELQISSRMELEDIKRTYAEVNAEIQKEFREQLERQSMRYEEEIYKKDMQYQELNQELEQSKVQAQMRARSLVENEMLEKDIQIQRFKEEVELLNKKLSKTQSELSGEAGEVNLLKKLKEAFPNDDFKTQLRGNSCSDIIHYIKTESGVVLHDTIVYDNKEAKSITKQDIEKAQRYREIHRTDYVIIVSKNLPCEIPEGLGGEKEGILIVHPQVVILLAREIRKALIEIAKQSSSKIDQQNKQAALYDYIRSREFSRNLALLYQLEIQLHDLQKKEEKTHHTLWKNRESLYKRLGQTYIDMSRSIGSIMEEEGQDGVQGSAPRQTKNELIEYSGNGKGNDFP